MKKLEVSKMEIVNGGRPTGVQAICTGLSIMMGIAIPIAGIAVSIACLWSYNVVPDALQS